MKRKHITRVAALALAGLMTSMALVGCGGSSSSSSPKADKTKDGNASKGKVYYLNFKPEADGAWQNLAKKYTEETGIEVNVETAAEGTYEETLTAAMDKSEAPTLFQVNGPVGLANWKDYCYDLKDSDIYSQLTSKDYALSEGDAVYGISYVIESYGIIYNKTILQKYFDSDFSTVKKIEDVNSFDALKTVADEIQANAAALGVKGAFTSAGMDSTSDWRFKTHLANLPIYFEYKEDGISSTDAIKGTYLDNYKKIFDLYVADSTCAGTDLANKNMTDAETEFSKGEAVFFQNGSWEYTPLTTAGLTDADLGMLPIYVGAGDEANQGLCTGSENFWCVNKNANKDDIAATLNFLNWCVTSEAGTTALAEDMGFVIPFKNAKEATNVFVKADAEYTANGKTPVSWNFTTMPSETWKNGVGTALTQYAAGTGSWDDVVTAFVDGWKTEYAAANAE
ncbi:MAG: ABC transporter substrate-binding protein [Ruminococcus sp.]|nr:ABC transporter substrate-binding protein [Ruminococcus sp.]